MKTTRFITVCFAALAVFVCGGCAASSSASDSTATTSTTNTTPTVTSTTTVAILSADQAKAIALADAGVSATDVTRLSAELERDDGKRFYDVSFRHGDVEYDYDIDAKSGAILQKESEKEPTRSSKKVTASTTTTTVALLSADEAKAIALADAGVSAADVTRLSAELERDDGKRFYDVSFRHGDIEYDYEIDAKTGSVLEKDRDRWD